MDSPGKTKSSASQYWWRQKVSAQLVRYPTSTQDRSLILLEQAADTGDVILLGQDGVEVPAHSAFLAESPYFKARLSRTWEGNTSFNFSNKLKLSLPLEASKEGLEVLLGYLYQGNKCFLRLGPLDSALMQEVLALGEACDLPDLCNFLIHLVKIDEGNVQSWLAWLDAERISNFSFILQQCASVVKTSFQCLAPQTVSMPAKDLLAVWDLTARLGSGAARSRGCSIKLGEVGHGQTRLEIITELDIHEHVGNTGFFDLVDWEKIATSGLEPDATVADLKALNAKQLGIPSHLQRFWVFCKRMNKTIRVDRVVSDREGTFKVEYL